MNDPWPIPFFGKSRSPAPCVLVLAGCCCAQLRHGAQCADTSPAPGPGPGSAPRNTEPSAARVCSGQGAGTIFSVPAAAQHVTLATQCSPTPLLATACSDQPSYTIPVISSQPIYPPSLSSQI